MTATNGNGTSDYSNIITNNTLFSSQIQITITSTPPYTYTYSVSPITATVTVTSLNPNTPIVCSLINMIDSYDISNNNVATLPLIDDNTYTLNLNNAGSFNIYAEQAPYGIYEPSDATSPLITINRFIPQIQFTDPNPPLTGTYGTPYNLTDPLITWVQPNSAPPGVTVTYSTNDPTVATFSDSINPSSFIIL